MEGSKRNPCHFIFCQYSNTKYMKFEFQSSTVCGTCYAVLALYFRVRAESFCKNKGGMMVKASEKTIKEEHILLTAVDSTLRIREDLGR